MINWLLCKIIGHKWIIKDVTAYSPNAVVVVGVCQRCLKAINEVR